MSKQERDICKFEWNLRNLFCCCPNLSNDDGHNYNYMPGLKTGVENDIIWSEIESGFGEPGGTPPPRILRCTPPRIQIGSQCGLHEFRKASP